MCGIAGIISLDREPIPDLDRSLDVMSRLLRHRGPDGEGVWIHPSRCAGFAHRRLSIIDIAGGGQPMSGPAGDWLTYNGEIYNYLELREELGQDAFTTSSDTETILHAYARWGQDCLLRFKGMYAFALWDESEGTLFCARDRFGVKPLYYAVLGRRLFFASEPKALLPFLDRVETDIEAFRDYLAFQFCLDGRTLFKGVREVRPGHCLVAGKGEVRERRYWEPLFKPDFDHTEAHFVRELRELLRDSIRLHLRSDVPVGAYVSGGLDSGVVASLAQEEAPGELLGFTGKFAAHGPAFDESPHARAVAGKCGITLHEADITCADFVQHMADVIYALDYPVAGPGAFSQYMVSGLAAQHRKVVLGGQGGDEIFGGYTRYLIAYFEQCIKAAIDGTMHNGKFIVTYESIIPNLTALASYKPLLKQFFSQGLFEDMDVRYFQLINRAPQLGDEINWELLNGYNPFDTFKAIFNGKNIHGKASYFDSMTNFDLKTLLPALLHVEDRMSMAHGLESRVPLLDHELVEKASTASADIKFKDGNLKYLFKNVVAPYLPSSILERKDKMGFPTPINDWIRNGARDYVHDLFSTSRARTRDLVDNARVLDLLEREPTYGRKLWGFLCLELWQQRFHDREHEFKQLLGNGENAA